MRTESFIRPATKLKTATAFLPLGGGGLITGKMTSDKWCTSLKAIGFRRKCKEES